MTAPEPPCCTKCCPPWPLTPLCLPDDWDPDTKPGDALAWRIASERLSRATGGFYGQCRVRVETCPPCPQARCMGLLCGCDRVCSIPLTAPAYGPVTVWVNGTAVDDPDGTLFHIEDGRELVRNDGGCYPVCARVEISYLLGWPVCPGDDASLAVTRYALALRNICTDAECAIDPRVTSMTRNTTTYDFTTEPGTFTTGVGFTDAWLAGVVGCRTPRPRPRVLTPDLPRLRVKTWPCACPP